MGGIVLEPDQHGGQGCARSLLSGRRWMSVRPPVGGTFQFQTFILAPSLEIWVKLFSVGGRFWRGSGVACFWAIFLEKFFGGVIAIISFRPEGWMQRRAEVCYPFLAGSGGASVKVRASQGLWLAPPLEAT